ILRMWMKRDFGLSHPHGRIWLRVKSLHQSWQHLRGSEANIRQSNVRACRASPYKNLVVLASFRDALHGKITNYTKFFQPVSNNCLEGPVMSSTTTVELATFLLC